MSKSDSITAPAEASAANTLALLHSLTEAGLLRHLDSALAHFIARRDPQASACLLLAAALLSHQEGRGHSCLPLAAVVQQLPSLLAWPEQDAAPLHALHQQLPPDLPGWVAAISASRMLHVAGQAADQGQPLVLARADSRHPLLYLRRYWNYERQVATHIQQRLHVDEADKTIATSAIRTWLERLFPTQDTATTDWQKVACALALRGRLSLITGGPGTGKTYTAARLLALLFATADTTQPLRVALAAPTGKAAARLKQAIDHALEQLQTQVGDLLDMGTLVQRVGAARTLHSLLGARPDTRHFSRHAGRPLEVDVLIVDEASMVHLEMMAALLDALPASARLILLGDKDQLASVEAGAVLGELCRDAQAGHYSPETQSWLLAASGQALPTQYLSPSAPAPALAQQTVMLRSSRRFGGAIGQLALAVNAGDSAAAQTLAPDQDAVRLLHHANPAQITALALHGRPGAIGYQAYVQALQDWPQVRASADFAHTHATWVRAVLHAFDRFRLLCAVREGDWGVTGINQAAEQALERAGSLRRSGSWYAGRPVMVLRNDAALGVFNGDIGITLPEQADGKQLRVYFLQGEQLHSVSPMRLPQVETAFAMTVHKSQGSEFEHTALVLGAQAGPTLTRELLYTGITRARQAFTLLAEHPGLLPQAIAHTTQRASGLEWWLTQSPLQK